MSNLLYKDDLASGISISKVVIQITYVQNIRTIVFTIILADSNNSNVINHAKDIIVTFVSLVRDLQSEIDKLLSLKGYFDYLWNVKNKLKPLRSRITNIKAIFKSYLIFFNENRSFTSGVLISKIVIEKPYNLDYLFMNIYYNYTYALTNSNNANIINNVKTVDIDMIS